MRFAKKKYLNTKTREESNRTFLSDVIMSRILVPTLAPTFELLDLSALKFMKLEKKKDFFFLIYFQFMT
jgi:hypothetical protein